MKIVNFLSLRLLAAVIMATVSVTSYSQTSASDKGVVINGYKFTDKATGNTIFLPAAGYREANDGRLEGSGTEGYYWSGTQGGGGRGQNIEFNSDKAFRTFDYRVYGFSIRPVAN